MSIALIPPGLVLRGRTLRRATIIGATVEIVASSWIDMLAGLSR